MSFEQLIDKVHQAEQALEASERAVAADWRHLRRSWLAAWTPGRIVVAGLLSGFVVGRAELVARRGGGGVLQLLTALSGLFASGSAQAAASQAGDAAHQAERTADVAGAPDIPRMRNGDTAPVGEDVLHERLRRAGTL